MAESITTALLLGLLAIRIWSGGSKWKRWVALLNAYRLTDNLKYWQAFDLQARFVMDRFVDHQYGEVYTAVFQDGKIDSEKVGPWKAPYHVTRACLEIISRLGGTL